MADKIVPDTESQNVAAFAIAWEIVRLMYIPNVSGSKDDMLKEVTNAVIKAYKAILKLELIEK